ncbi:uncharacterized protein [Nicotiana tomentosiformis]|uniref:uncharacterized protein n=1 Tax=Nicotiana tomentosiformis TaxID=4098 RepID=UPI00388CC9BA
MVSAQVATLPAPPARGGGQVGRGHPRGGGQARFYAFPDGGGCIGCCHQRYGYDFYVIFGMDWLSLYYVILDCHTKTVTLAIPGLSWLEWRGTFDYIPSRVVSFLKVQQTVKKGCEAYLSFVIDVSVDTPTVELVLVVRDFPFVFPADLSDMPPRDIDFGIDLVPGTQSISIPPYRIAPVELKELKEQLQELLDKGFDQPSV